MCQSALMPEPHLVGSAEAARMCGRTVATMNRWAAAGLLPVALRLPGRTGANLFKRRDVERLARERAA